MIECVVNVSEGRNRDVIASISAAAGSRLLDVHSDRWHNRSVLTLGGESDDVSQAARSLARETVRLLDIRRHEGVHPRLGVVDVVPFVPLGEAGRVDDVLEERAGFATWFAEELGVPCFLYGPERSLPEVRRRAYVELKPDIGPPLPHPTAGACCVGARGVLVAYNLFVKGSFTDARRVAGELRRPEVRTLGLEVGSLMQVSCNLVAPAVFGPAQVYDFVAARLRVIRAELVGLLPCEVLHATDERRWSELDLSEDRTIESHLAKAG
jgi:glutamate formiminotransferase